MYGIRGCSETDSIGPLRLFCMYVFLLFEYIGILAILSFSCSIMLYMCTV